MLKIPDRIKLERNTLNILNGQNMQDYFKQQHFDQDGLYVPFNEAMCIGRVPMDIFSNKFNKCRCDAHHITMGQYNEVTLMPLQILFENQFSHIVLWFDNDMFCQINLLTLLAYLNQINYSKKVTFNLVNRAFQVVDCFELEVEGYEKIYKQVMINSCIPQELNLPVMKNGVKLYFEYLKDKNEIIAFIRQHEDLKMNVLVRELIKTFPQYGLGDTQYIQLIEENSKYD